MKMGTLTHIISLTSLLLLPLHCHARYKHSASLTHKDLLSLVELFSGEFDNAEQNEEDTINMANSSNFHFFIRRLHVPVKIPALQKAAGDCSKTQQIYLEQYFAGSSVPQIQRIFSFILRDGRILMEIHQHHNRSATKAWENWRTNPAVFEDIQAEDLQHDDNCTLQWTHMYYYGFIGRIHGRNCIFDFRNNLVYIRSEVQLTRGKLTQDEQFISVQDGSVVSGTKTPFIYKEKANPDIPQVSENATKTSNKKQHTCSC